MKVIREYKFKNEFLVCRVSVLNEDEDDPFFPYRGFLVLKARVQPLLEHPRHKYFTQLQVQSLGDDFSLIDVADETARFCSTLKTMYQL